MGIPFDQGLEELPAAAKNIVSMMLRKFPDVRPKRERCGEVLKQCAASVGQAVSRAASQMAEAVSVVAVDQAQREAERRVSEERKRKRAALFDEAVRELKGIKLRLFSRILDHAHDVVGGAQGQNQSARLTLGQAAITFDTGQDSLQGIRRADQGWGVHPRRSKWDIVAFSQMSIAQMKGQQPLIRGANLVFGRGDDDAEYRVFEMAFWSFGDERGVQGYPGSVSHVFEMDEALSHKRAYHKSRL